MLFNSLKGLEDILESAIHIGHDREVSFGRVELEENHVYFYCHIGTRIIMTFLCSCEEFSKRSFDEDGYKACKHMKTVHAKITDLIATHNNTVNEEKKPKILH